MSTPIELRIPLGDCMQAVIPFPMPEEEYDLMIQTLELWKGRLTRRGDDKTAGVACGFRGGLIITPSTHLDAKLPQAMNQSEGDVKP